MVKEQSRFREGENPRSDQQRKETTSNQGHFNDLLKDLNQFQDRQHHKEKAIMTHEMEMKSIQDRQEIFDRNHRHARDEILTLRQGKTSLQSEIPLGYKDGLRGGGKLPDGSWNTLKNSLTSLKTAFDAKDSENSINTKLQNLRSKIDVYLGKGDDNDHIYLTNMHNRLPENAKDPVFLDSIRVCLEYVESGKNP